MSKIWGKISKILFSRKAKVLFFCFFIFFGLFFTTNYIYAVNLSGFLISPVAGLVGLIAPGLAGSIANNIISLFFYVVLGIAQFCAYLASLILAWILSPAFMQAGSPISSYTDPAHNTIIKLGLQMTQGLVNMGIILVLVFIGLATILRLQGYETKKLLVTFIIIALLVNFSPVLCGLVVDASNIVMHFFTNTLSPSILYSKLSSISNDAVAKIKSSGTDPSSLWTGVAQCVVITIMFFMLAVILLAFAAVLLVRYLAIWILVILSPLAFACYILPITQDYFRQWLRQFIQWCFVGITLPFFLWLGINLFNAINVVSGNSPISDVPQGAATAAGAMDIGALGHMMVFMVPVIFLGIGLIYGLQTSAMGANGVFNAVKKFGYGTEKWAGMGLLRGAIQRSWIPNSYTKDVKRDEEGNILMGKDGKPIMSRRMTYVSPRDVGREFSDIWDRVPLVRWAQPDAFRNAMQAKPAIDAARASTKDLSSSDIGEKIWNGTFRGEKATAGFLNILDRGDAQDIFTSAKKYYKLKTDEDVINDPRTKKILGEAMRKADNAGQLNDFVRTDPRLARIAVKEKVGSYAIKTEKAAIKKALKEMRDKHIQKAEPELLTGTYVAESALGYWGRENWISVDRNIKGGRGIALFEFDSDFSNWIDNEEKRGNLNALDLKKAIASGNKKDIEDYNKLLWEGYREHIKSQNEGNDGYFKALEDDRFRNMGWREATWIPEEERSKNKRLPPSTPATAAGVPPRPSGRAAGGSGGKPSGRAVGGP